MKVSRRFLLSLELMLAVGSWSGIASAQFSSELEARIQQIVSRPTFAHARFGIKIVDADGGHTLYELNPQELFVPGSTTKLATMGTGLALLGGDYRFSTKVYRTGPIDHDGTLRGDLILVASGDLNLSNRIQRDDTLSFEDHDHSLGGSDAKGLPGDPLRVFKEFAGQIANHGIHRVEGRILVDATLFPEGEREKGTNTVISPIEVNDNIVDVVVTPGASEGAPVTLRVSPETSYVKIVNQATTGKKGTNSSLKYVSDRANPDGTRVVILSGTIAAGALPNLVPYDILEPSRFAAIALAEILGHVGVSAASGRPEETIDFKSLSANYTPDKLVAEHVSPPLSQEVKVTLKVSQNLHASSMPYLLGALVAHNNKDSAQAGFDLENQFLTKAGLDLSGAAQGDGAGGDAFFTPAFMVSYLRYMSSRKDFQIYYNALPILGRDGTLAKIQVKSEAAGHVHAKTGTFETYDALNRKVLVMGKGLAGYIDTTKGKHLIFALYANMVSVPADNDWEAIQTVVGETLGEIAAAAYSTQ